MKRFICLFTYWKQQQSFYYWNKTLQWPVFSDQDCPVSKTGTDCKYVFNSCLQWVRGSSVRLKKNFPRILCLGYLLSFLHFYALGRNFDCLRVCLVTFPSLGLVRTVKVTFYYFLTLYLSLPRHSKLLTYFFFKVNCVSSKFKNMLWSKKLRLCRGQAELFQLLNQTRAYLFFSNMIVSMN
jgi:hypothetical protein